MSSIGLPGTAQGLDKEMSPQTFTPNPRRSSRKRKMPIYFGSSGQTPPTHTKKSRKLCKAYPVKLTLLNLPYCAIKTLLLFLDVDSLENLSKTCSYFDKMIAGKYLTSINFPFPADFIEEMIGTNRVDKKPLLKLICNKSREELDQSSSSFPSIDKLILQMSPVYADYLVLSQLSLLSLQQLREVDLVPYSMKSELNSNKPLEAVVVEKYNLFDSRLLQQISRLGSFNNVTRLDVLVDENFYIAKFLPKMPKLLELGLNILARKDTCPKCYRNALEDAVSASRAPVLKIKFVEDNKHLTPKVLRNNFVEKLVVTGPCTAMVFPVMRRLKEVVVNLESSSLSPCHYKGSKVADRGLHRAGMCCVNVGAIYRKCLRVERFMGVEVGLVRHNQTFKQWNVKVKKLFYDDYLRKGGSLGMRAWATSRWFSKRLFLPNRVGYNRIPIH